MGDLVWPARAAQRWFESNTIPATDAPDPRTLGELKRQQGLTVSVAIPALNEEPTVGEICRVIRKRLQRDAGLVDELVVLDGGSEDGTAAAARRAGARVVDVRAVIPEVAFVRGKGESLWRSLAATDGDIIVWIDADIRNFGPRFVARLVAPLLEDPRRVFAKATYRRPLEHAGRLEPAGGGRVTELLARPLLNLLFPELAGFLQPLSGEYAGHRNVLEQLPFFTGYSVEAGLLIDLLGTVGLDAMVQVDLEERVHRNRPLDELTPMAASIGHTILRRAEQWGRVKGGLDASSMPLLLPGAAGSSLTLREVVELERPPMRYLRGRHAPARAALP